MTDKEKEALILATMEEIFFIYEPKTSDAKWRLFNELDALIDKVEEGMKWVKY